MNMSPKVSILIMCLIWAKVDGELSSSMSSFEQSSMSSLEQCSMQSDDMSMPPDSMWMSADSMSMQPDSMSMPPDSMSMPPDSMSMPPDSMWMSSYSGWHHNPSETRYMTDSEGNTICYFPPMSHSHHMSSYSDMAGPPMSSSMAGPPMSNSMAGPPMSSNMAGPPMSSSMAGSQMSSSMAGPPMSSSMAGPPMSSSMAGNPMSSGTPPMVMPSSTQEVNSPPTSSIQPTPSSSMEMSPSATVSGCDGTIDCAGVCKGLNVNDSDCNICYGPQGNYSSVSDFKDCSSTCFGTASINTCGYCTGGNTGKTDTEGVDSCNGMCKNSPKYIDPTDCNGDCNGTAILDVVCTGLCIGGNTGRLLNHSRDCSNICNGTNEIDTCGYCTAPYAGQGGSAYKGCDGTCATPARQGIDNGFENKCGTCVGGTTNKTADHGIDVCGVCSGDNSTCTDCDGTVNGGKVVDACGVCGGTGDTCSKVASISPTHAPSVTETSLDLLGAGFSTSSGKTCYMKKGSDANIELVVVNIVSLQKQVVTIPNTVTAGTYKVDCISGSDMSAASIELMVYDSTGVALTSISPATFILGATTDTQQLTLTGTGFIDTSTYCIVDEKVITATYISATSATCTINHPARSNVITVYLSLNGIYKHQSVNVTAQAAAPTASAEFAIDNAAEITVTFSDVIDTSSFSNCSDVFDTATVTALGSDAICVPVSGKKLVISRSSLNLGSSITPKADTIKQNKGPESLPLNSAISVSTPAKAVSPVARILGPNEIGSCSDLLSLTAFTGLGGVGRDLVYVWRVNPATATIVSSGTQTTNVTGVSPGSYTFTLIVTNFFNKETRVTKTIVKRSVSLPKLYVSSTGGETVLVSESFDLIANAELVKGCADDTLTFAWSFSGGIIADTIQKTRQRYTITPNSLPAGQTVTATVMVALESKPGDAIEGNIVFTTEYPALDARIKGSSTRTIGVDGGSLSLDASISVDPSQLGDMTYSWRCENNVGAGCLSADGTSFPTSSNAVFTFNANIFLPATQYKFTVTIQSGSRTSQASVVVNAIAGNPPKVVMSEIENGGYIERTSTVKLDATIFLPSAGASVTSIVWTSVQDDGQAFVDLSNVNNLAIEGKQIDLGNNKVYGIIALKGGVLEKGERYTLMATVTDNSNNVVTGSVDVNVYTGVKSCQLQAISSYTALQQVDVKVSKCMTDAAGGSLSYKLFVQTDANGGRLALTENLVSSTMSVQFAPKAYQGSTNIFIVQVCAKRGGCMEVTSDPVTVTSITPAQIAAKKADILASVADLQKTSEPLKGAVMVGVFLESSSSTSSRRKRSVSTDDIHTALLDLISDSLTSATKTEARISSIMDVMCAIDTSSVSDVDLQRANGFYDETISFLGDNSVAILKKHAECYLGFYKNIKTRSLTADSLVPKITRSIAKGMSYGDMKTISMSGEYDSKHSVEIPGSSYTTGAATNAIQIDFGSTLTSQYGSWSCSSGTCSGVLIKSQHYATTVDPFSTLPEDINNRASDVLSVDLLDPLNGDALSAVTNLATPITLQFPVTKPEAGATYKCKYWDVGTSTWKDDGVTAATQTASQVDCTSNHLTSFAVFKEQTTSDDDDGGDNNLAAIIGGTIAGIILIVFIVIIIVIVVKKKKDDTKVHSRENLRDEEIGS